MLMSIDHVRQRVQDDVPHWQDEWLADPVIAAWFDGWLAERAQFLMEKESRRVKSTEASGGAPAPAHQVQYGFDSPFTGSHDDSWVPEWAKAPHPSGQKP